MEANAITGVYNSSRINLLAWIGLKQRDDAYAPSRVSVDVRHRVMLALSIVIQGGVFASPVEGVYYVKRGISSRNLLQFGSHRPERVEARLPQSSEKVAEPMLQFMLDRFEAQGVPARGKYSEGFYTVQKCKHGWTCICWDFVYRGSTRGGCKHTMAVELRLNSSDETTAQCAAIGDFAGMMRSREKRVPKELQVDTVTNEDDYVVWKAVESLATQKPRSIDDDCGFQEDSEQIDECFQDLPAKKVTKSAKCAPSAWMLFNKSEREKVIEELRSRGQPSLSFGQVSTVVGERWRKLQPRQRQVWEEKAKKATREHERSISHAESSGCDERSGPARAMVPKARHAWRSHVDSMRPKFGLRDRDRAPGGGIGAFQRVDASNAGRESRIAMAARARKKHAGMVPATTNASASMGKKPEDNLEKKRIVI